MWTNSEAQANEQSIYLSMFTLLPRGMFHLSDMKLYTLSAAVVAQLVVRSLLTPEVQGSKPLMGKKLY